MRPRPRGRRRAVRGLAPAWLLLGAVLPASPLLAQAPPPAPAAPTPPEASRPSAPEPARVPAVVNGEARQAVTLLTGPGGELKVPVEDLKGLGLTDLPLFRATLERGRLVLALSALFPRVEAHLDETSGVLYLTVHRGPPPEAPERRPGARAYEPAVLAVTVNGAPVGDRIVYRDADGRVLVAPEDLRGFGLARVPQAALRLVEGEAHVALDDVGDWLSYTLDERAARLDVTVDPAYLVRTVVDLGPGPAPGTERVDATGGFLNYAAHYQAGEGGDFQTLSVPLEAGLRALGAFAFTDALYTRTPDTGAGARDRMVRQETHLTLDDETDLTRLRLGDVTAVNTPLGGAVRLGGASWSRQFGISPHFIRYPGLDLTGTLSTPSEVDIYVDGVRVRRDRLPAGDFTYRDLPRTTGAGAATLVIRDAFGRESRVQTPFYIAPGLLKEGLASFSYNVGVLRENYGTRSFDYGVPAFSAFHRVGTAPWLNLGASAEGRDGLASGGPDALVVLGRAGEVDAAAAWSRARGVGGDAWRAVYAYAGRTLGLSLSGAGRSRDFVTLSLPAEADRPRLELGGTVSLSLRRFGSLSLSATRVTYHEAADLRRTSLYFSRPLGAATSLFARASRTDQGRVEDEAFVGLNRYLGAGTTAAAEYQTREEVATARARVQRNAPLGPGWGYRLDASRTEDPDGALDGTDAHLGAEYHGPWGIYRAEARLDGDTETYLASAAGALAWTGATVRATRPVNDAFALVRVPGVKGIGVYRYGRLTARTDAGGVAMVPDMVSYVDNRVTIDARSLPLGASVGTGSRTVTLPYRGTGEITFPVTALRAYVGHLAAAVGRRRVPVELTWMTLDGGPRVPVGRGGEFYLENLAPGPHPARVPWKDGECRFTIDIPEEGDVLVDLGEVVCAPR